MPRDAEASLPLPVPTKEVRRRRGGPDTDVDDAQRRRDPGEVAVRDDEIADGRGGLSRQPSERRACKRNVAREQARDPLLVKRIQSHVVRNATPARWPPRVDR